MGRTTGSWTTQQLTDFVAAVSRSAEAATAARIAVERVAEALDAEVAAVVAPKGVLAALGFPAGSQDAEQLHALVRGGIPTVEVAGVGECILADAPLETFDGARLVVARRERPFDVDEIGLLRGMARVLGAALGTLRALESERRQAEENGRLLASLAEKQRLLEGLARVQQSIATRARLSEVLETLVEGARAVVGVEYANVKLIDVDDPSTMVTMAAAGHDEALTRGVSRAPVGEGLSGRAIVENRLLVSDDYATLRARSRLAPQNVRAAMATPVHEHGTVVGSILVATADPDRSFSEAEQEVFATFAEHASLALAAARSADRMRHAFNDDLTGLANRALFLNRLEHALTVADRRGEAVTVLFVDLDGFKVVNDSLGHLIGDELLVEVSRRLAGSLRRADTAARLGGDEFAVLVQDATTTDGAERAAQRVIEALRQPFTIADREVFVSASIGIAHGRSEAATLLREADVAMYHAKALGKARYAIFEQHMHTAALERLELEADLRRGLDRGELELHYQPVFELATRRLRGVEALVRWRHPERGLVPPFEFIPLAEETGLIHRIGNWVRLEACEQVAEWNRMFEREHALAVAVNVSGVELQRPELVDEVRAVLEATGIPASSLVLEITESVLMQDSELTTRRLSDLRALDVRLAIDDFGTGYSSLRYLSRFPVDVLKIAKPFIDRVHSGTKQDLALARMIVDLGANLGLRTVAEGVEVREQEDVMRELGCDFGQGYLLARPLPPRELETLLARRLPAAA